MEKKRRTLKGTVVSDRPQKSVVVEVSTKKKHPRYGKQVKWSKKYMVHDENNEAKSGYVVEIVESRPHSKRKTFVLGKVITKVEEIK